MIIYYPTIYRVGSLTESLWFIMHILFIIWPCVEIKDHPKKGKYDKLIQ